MMKKKGDDKTFAEKTVCFYEEIALPKGLPKDVAVLNPFLNEEVRRVGGAFYKKYYSDQKGRIFILGINPGRFGAGITGIPFTDPYELSESCGISHEFGNGREMSAGFVYETIRAFGGAEKFYKHFYITSVCPVGFVKGKVNYNYYDDKELLKAVRAFMVKTLKQQLDFGAKKTAIILGTGKNQKFFKALNDEYGFFEDFVVFPHPRYVMQYKSKEKPVYIERFKELLLGML